MSKTKHLLNAILSLTEVAGKVGVPRPDLSMTLDDFTVPKDFTFEKSLVRGVYKTPKGEEIKIQYDTVSTTIEVFDDEKCVYVELENLEYTV